MNHSLATHAVTSLRAIVAMLFFAYISGFIAFALGTTLYWMSYAMYGFLWIPYVGRWLTAYSGWFQSTLFPVLIQCGLGYLCMFLTLRVVKAKREHANIYVMLAAAALTYLVYGYYLHPPMWYFARIIGILAFIDIVLLFIFLRRNSRIVVPQGETMNDMPPPPPPAHNM